MIRAELADGRILEFPDGTDPQVVQATVKRLLSQQPDQSLLSPRAISELTPEQQKQLLEASARQQSILPNPPKGPSASVRRQQAFEQLRRENPQQAAIIEELSPAEAAAIGFQSGLRSVARGAGRFVGADIFEQDPSIQQLTDVSGSAQFGEIVGQSAPFAAAAPASGLGLTTTTAGRTLVPAFQSTGARAAGTAALGGAEGATITSGEGGTTEEILQAGFIGALIGGGAEVAIPAISSAVRQRSGVSGQVFKPSGELTEEVQEKIASQGITQRDFLRDAINDTEIPADQRKIAQDALGTPALERTGIPATRGEVLQQQVAQGQDVEEDVFAQLKREQQLLEQSSGPGEELRALKLRQSQEAEGILTNLTKEDANSVGTTVKDALEQRLSDLKSERRKAYDRLAEVTQDHNVGLEPTKIIDALPDAGDASDFAAISPGPSNALNNLLIEFGLTESKADRLIKIDAPEHLVQAAKDSQTVTPVSVANYERMRKRLNNIESSDATGQAGRIIGPIRQALDDEFELASRQLEASGNESVATAAREARLSHVALKTEFDPKGMVDQLVAPKARGSRVPKIEDSNVYTKLASKSVSEEQFGNVIESLKKSGVRGNQAIDEMKSRAMMDLINSAFNASTRKINGQRVFGAVPFNKRFDQLTPKLKTLLSESEFKKLSDLRKDVENIIPPTGTVPKGSAGFFIDALDNLGLLNLTSSFGTAGAVAVNALKSAARSARDAKDLEKAMKNPNIMDVVTLVRNDYPSLGAALFGGQIAAQENEDGVQSN